MIGISVLARCTKWYGSSLTPTSRRYWKSQFMVKMLLNPDQLTSQEIREYLSPKAKFFVLWPDFELILQHIYKLVSVLDH